jgi:hypothetical protein
MQNEPDFAFNNFPQEYQFFSLISFIIWFLTDFR